MAEKRASLGSMADNTNSGSSPSRGNKVRVDVFLRYQHDAVDDLFDVVYDDDTTCSFETTIASLTPSHGRFHTYRLPLWRQHILLDHTFLPQPHINHLISPITILHNLYTD